jgi:hypothetical protein
LGLVSSHFTPQVQEAMTRLGSRLPYGEAQQELKLMWGLTVSPGAIRQATLAHGRLAEQLVADEVERIEQQGPTPTAKPKQLVMSTDGAFVQLINGEWREVKTVTFGEFASRWNPKSKQVVVKTEQLSYFSRVEPAENFSRSALYEWQQRGGENAQRVVAVNDGARWIQAFIDYHCPTAVRVIDFAHAQSYLALVGKAIYGADNEAFAAWYPTASQQLAHQPPQRTVADLRLLQAQHDPSGENMEIAQAIQYLHHRLDMIDYPHFRRQQLPIGSGIAESGNKVVMQRRMKQAGMRWAESSLNPLLALRNALCNQRWHTTWLAIYQQRRLAQRQQTLQRRQPPVTPPLTFASLSVSPEIPALSQATTPPPLPSKPVHPWQAGKWPLRHRC